MPIETSYLKLKKPLLNESADVQVLNENSEIIDTFAKHLHQSTPLMSTTVHDHTILIEGDWNSENGTIIKLLIENDLENPKIQFNTKVFPIKTYQNEHLTKMKGGIIHLLIFNNDAFTIYADNIENYYPANAGTALEQNKANKSLFINALLTVDNWVSNDDQTLFTQTIAIPDHNPLTKVLNVDYGMYDESVYEVIAESRPRVTSETVGSITVTAYEIKPTLNIPIIIEMRDVT